MERSTHLRGNPSTRAACGAGYDWPSSISLTDDPKQVTCQTCRDRPPGETAELTREYAEWRPVHCPLGGNGWHGVAAIGDLYGRWVSFILRTNGTTVVGVRITGARMCDGWVELRYRLPDATADSTVPVDAIGFLYVFGTPEKPEPKDGRYRTFTPYCDHGPAAELRGGRS
jgi:hypothetical protein